MIANRRNSSHFNPFQIAPAVTLGEMLAPSPHLKTLYVLVRFMFSRIHLVKKHLLIEYLPCTRQCGKCWEHITDQNRHLPLWSVSSPVRRQWLHTKWIYGLLEGDKCWREKKTEAGKRNWECQNGKCGGFTLSGMAIYAKMRWKSCLWGYRGKEQGAEGTGSAKVLRCKPAQLAGAGRRWKRAGGQSERCSRCTQVQPSSL